MNHPKRSSTQITEEIQKIANDFAFSFPPHWLREAGYTQGQIELAVRRGVLRWNRDGSLSLISSERQIVEGFEAAAERETTYRLIGAKP